MGTRIGPIGTRIAGISRSSWATLRAFDRDKGFFLASALSFSVLLSLIPFCLLLLSILGTWLSGDSAMADHLADYLPSLTPGLDPAAAGSLLGIVRHRRIVGVLGLAGLAWTSTMLFGALRISLNAIFGVPRGRGTLRALGADLLMIFLSGSMLTASMVLTSWISVLQRFGERHVPQIGPLATFLLKYPVPLLFSVLMCFMLYTIAPNRRVPAVPALKAALFSGLLWELAKQLFGWYVLHLGRYSLVYGSLSTAAIFVLWIYYSAVIFLLGAEVAKAIEAQGREPRPPHRPGNGFLPG
jgi:membrane protein